MWGEVVNGKDVGYANFLALPTRDVMSLLSHEKEWADRAKRFLKAELKRADVTYEDLAARLNAKGWGETKHSVASKLSRGAFTATFFLAALTEIGCEVIRLEEV